MPLSVVTTNSKLEHEEFCFQKIPLQAIGKLLKIVWNISDETFTFQVLKKNEIS